ncbi:MAG: heavy-metal-associated domain-containing protein [Lentisphaerae bacterium]|nr:heavy-metal-associated domain-containing protein [Lentisphaerota bacterium]
MKTIRFQLETLTCPSCVARIEGVLNKEPGVEQAKVLFNSSRVKVEYDSKNVTTGQLAKVIEDIGFPVLS